MSIAAVMVPTEAALLVVPSEAVAEIAVKPVDLKPLPAVEPWVLGYFFWRNCPVTLVSFERLAVGRELTRYSRVCVFYPLPGRREHEFFALATNGDPRSVAIDKESGAGPQPEGVLERFVSGTLSVAGQTLAIPNFDALNSAFYSR